MISAAEARRLSKKNNNQILKEQLRIVNKNIGDAIGKGEFSVTVNRMCDGVVWELDRCGYYIKNISNEKMLISWEEVGFEF